MSERAHPSKESDGARGVIDLGAYRQYAAPGVAFTELPQGALRITLGDPVYLNAMPQQFHDALPEFYGAVAADPTVRAVVLQATGEFFSAGGRVDEGMKPRDAGELVVLHRIAARVITRLLEVPQPTMCVVNGPAIGFAANLALHHDLIVASDTAYFADSHVRFGAAAGDGGTSIWPLALGPAKAKEFLFTGNRLSATEAERRGLINRVASADQLESCANELLGQVMGQAPLAVRLTKMAINTRLRSQAEWDMNLGLAAEMITLGSNDFRRSVEAFNECGRFGSDWAGN